MPQPPANWSNFNGRRHIFAGFHHQALDNGHKTVSSYAKQESKGGGVRLVVLWRHHSQGVFSCVILT
ncbi:hypothetical protein MTBLM1_20517 [Rhodospirillaceae bacterium LM-1]|nr:hypothetical protein MTBLM1_20517 [Rhodospirillaceae bacterium LM-1]